MTLQQLQQEGATPNTSGGGNQQPQSQMLAQTSSNQPQTPPSSGGQSFNVSQLQQEGAVPNTTPTTATAPQTQNQSFLQNEKQNWNQTMQDRADAQSGQNSPPEEILRGAADVSDMAIGTPIKHAVGSTLGLLSKVPGLGYLGQGFNQGVQNLKNSPLGQTVSQGINNYQQNNPRMARNIGSAVDLGTNVALGAGAVTGASALANIPTWSSQAVGGIKNTLVNSLGYDPDVADDISSTIGQTGNAASMVAAGDHEGAQAVLDTAMDGEQGTQLSDLQTAYQAIERMKSVSFDPTMASTLSSDATGLMGKVASGAAHAGTSALRGAGLIGGAGLVGYPLARYEGWIK